MATVATKEQARTEFSVRRNCNRLLNLFQVEANLLRSEAGWVAKVGPLEAKCGLGLRLWEEAQHADALRRRLVEQRLPEERIGPPRPEIRRLLERMDCAPDAAHFFVALYRVLKPALIREYRHHLERVDPVADDQTPKLLKSILADELEHVAWSEEALGSVITNAVPRKELAEWQADLEEQRAAAGGLCEESEVIPPIAEEGQGTSFWAWPIEPVPTPVKDPRYRFFAPGEQQLPPCPPLETEEGRRRYLHWWIPYEWAAAELPGRNLYEFPDMPWEFYLDMARQCADEIRHGVMYLRHLRELGGDIGSYPVTGTPWVGNYEVPYAVDLIGRLILLNRSGEGPACEYLARQSEQVRAAGDMRLAQLHDYDMADECRHGWFGNRWLRYLLNNDEEALKAATKQAREEAKQVQERIGISKDAPEMVSQPVMGSVEEVGPDPVNILGRKLAGFTDAEIARLVENRGGRVRDF